MNSDFIKKIIKGDVPLVNSVAGNDQELVNKYYDDAGRPRLTKESLICALVNLKTNKISKEDAQKWASFILRGHLLCTNKKRLIAVDIEIDTLFENELVEIMVRLDELGDLIDGEMTNEEIDRHLATLKAL